MAKSKKSEDEENTAVDFTQDGDSLMVDFNNVEGGDFEALPKARYPLIVEECEFEYSSNNNPMWSMKLEVEDGEYAGRKLFYHLVMAGKGLPMTKKQLGKIRPDLLEGPFDPQDEALIDSMIGLRIIGQVTLKKYEGDWTNNIKNVFPAEEDDGFS